VAITFVNAHDQYRFAQIETLIEKTIPKLALPSELGAGTPWNPKKQQRSFGGRTAHGGGKKNFGAGKRNRK